ncbi:MAG: RNA 2',3'-cyclic phosphodiesterase [Deltaproteobacteria bacterium]|nr:RNA 2',3'-cyclic phosphodiesterase [Deltaproteobacteria bacterium]
MPDHRLFIAIELPDDIIKKLKVLQEQLRKDCKAKVSWSKPENTHLTLKFLGNVQEDVIDKINPCIENACNGISQFMLSAEGVGSFPNLNNPKVIWIGIKPHNDLLNNICERLEQGLNNIGFEKEKRKFHPHLTLGRIRYADKDAGLKTGIDKLKDFAIGEFMVKSIILFESELNPNGAVYTKLKEIKLGC